MIRQKVSEICTCTSNHTGRDVTELAARFFFDPSNSVIVSMLVLRIDDGQKRLLCNLLNGVILSLSL